MLWAKHVLRVLNVKVQVANSPSPQKPLLFLGTHVSYLDILVLMATTPEIVFVAKAEIQSWPVIGKACKRVGIIFVKRENKSSRGQARVEIVQALKSGKRVVIFPSGTTTLFEEKPWRNGPFEIAQMLQQEFQEALKTIQPFRLSYSPLRQAAYIGDDTFAAHVVKLLQGPTVSGTVEFGQPLHVSTVDTTRDETHNWVRGLSFQRIRTEDCYPLRSAVLRNGKSFEYCQFPEDGAPTTLHFGAFKHHSLASNENSLVSNDKSLVSNKKSLVSIVTLIALPQDHDLSRKLHTQKSELKLKSTYQLRGMATATDLQGQGVGAALVRFAERYLKQEQLADSIILNAREKAFSFYAKLGYRDLDGTIFQTEHGPHKTMWKMI